MSGARWARRAGIGLGALLGVGVLAFGAWAWANRADDPPRPLPAALAAPPGDAAAARTAWERHFAPVDEAAGRDDERPGPVCRAGRDCVERWSAAPEALATLAGRAGLRARCEDALGAGPLPEPWPEPGPDPGALLPNYAGIVQCARAFAAGAVVAAARGDLAATVDDLDRASRWTRARHADARTLIGTMIAVAGVNLQLDAVETVLRLRPEWAASLRPSVRPWPAALDTPARWMAAEAAFGRATVAASDPRCPPDVDGLEVRHDIATVLTCALRDTSLGWLPRATQHALDDLWVARIARVQPGTEAWLRDAVAARGRPPQADGASLHWRNTFGELLIAVARDDALYDGYVARSADLVLRRDALALALDLTAAGVPAPARATWLQAHRGAPAAPGDRVRLDADGRRLLVRAWAPEVGERDRALPPIELPDPPTGA